MLNALVAAETIPTFKPAGLSLTAIDRSRMLKLLAAHGRLAP